MRAAVSHDSNVPLAATETNFSGSRSTNVLALGLAGDYRLYRDSRWTVVATGGVQQTHNGDPALREFDVTSIAPGIVARRGLRISGKPATLTMSYAARRDWLGGSGFASSHSASFDLGIRPARGVEAGSFFAVASSDFDDDGPSPAFSSRDAVSYRSGLRGSMSFNGYRQAVLGSLAYVKNDAKGANFVFQGPAATVQVVSLFWGAWAVAASASYARADYTNYAVAPRRESTAKDFRLVIYGPITRKSSVDLSLGRSRYESNQQAFEATRQNIVLGFTYAY